MRHRGLRGKPAALRPGERIRGREGSSAPSRASVGGPSAPLAWLIGDVRPFDVGRAFLELVLLVLVGVLLVVLFHGGDR